MEDIEDESFVGRILDKISVLHKKEFTKLKYIKKTFPEEFHPRRHKLYRQFTPNYNMFFRLRSHGVPVLTAYFLCEPSNMTRLHRQLQEKDCLERGLQRGLQRDDALSVIKNI